MLKIKEAVIVEGRYDKIKLSSLIDAPIIETHGFRVFSDKEKQNLIRQIADSRGILILTDSDSAGFVIRNFLKGVVDKTKIVHCYIPQIEGKEKRKSQKGKEGLLGVEGVSDEVIINAVRKSGATIIGESSHKITTTLMTPPILEKVVDRIESSNFYNDSIRFIMVGGKNFPVLLKLRALKIFGNIINEYYGSSETGINTLSNSNDIRKYPESSAALPPRCYGACCGEFLLQYEADRKSVV